MKQSSASWHGAPRIRAAALLVALSLGTAAAEATTLEAAAPGRLVAIGDIHGELAGLRAILERAGLVDEAGLWAGGDAVLVQTGDMVDRGAAVRGVMDLLMALQESAPEQGGRVVVLTGNHENMNLLRLLRDVGAEALEAFADDDSEQRRHEAWGAWQHWLAVHTERLGSAAATVAPSGEEEWLAAHPRGHLEYLRELGPEGRYGRWLRTLPVVARVERTLLLHGGLSDAYAELPLAEINRRHTETVARFDAAWRRLETAGVLLPSFGRDQGLAVLELYARRDPGAPPLPPEVAAAVAEGIAAFNDAAWIFQADSPLWYRGFSSLGTRELAPLLALVQRAHDVDRVVAGHTTRRDGEIGWRLGDLLYLIDTGMLAAVYGGRPAALEVVGPRVTALYLDREELLASGPEEQLATRTYRIPRRVWLDADGRPLPFQDPETAEAFLRSARILSSQETPVGVTRPRKVLLEKDGVRAHAIVHQVNTGKKRVRLEDGSFHMHFVDSYRSQIAAYELSRLLGMQAVPPTVARGTGGKGASMQLWIEQVIDETKRSKEGLSLGPRGYLRHQAWDRAVFHNLVRNVDANQGNILWDRSGNIWLVDHTRTLAPDARLAKPEIIERCSRQLYEALRDLDPSEVERRLSPTLSRYEIRALLERRQRVMEIIEERIRTLGEDQVLFDYGTRESAVSVRYRDEAA